MHDAQSIATDAQRVLAAAQADLSDKRFAKYVKKHELDVFAANIAGLTAGEGARSIKLHAQVAAGVHAAEVRAPIVRLLSDVREEAKLRFPKDVALQHAFGVGTKVNEASTSSVTHAAHQLLAAHEAHPKEAATVGVDAKVVHHLEDVLHALDGADLAHVQAASDRHDASTTTDSLAHLVTSETAHLRLVAHHVFKDDAAKLDRYARTLPRHEVKPRAKVATPPPAAPTT
jgi:hypothetical protein